jgi:hypothetical protein
MTGAEAARVLGAEASLAVSARLRVDVRITDAKTSYGSVRYLVTPLAGWGAEWVDASRVVLSRVAPEARPSEVRP